jgi:ribosomal protein L29
MKDPNRMRVEEIRREIERLKEEYAGSKSGGNTAREANENRRQRLIELKQELAQMMR